MARRDRLLIRLRDAFVFFAFAVYAGGLSPALRNLRQADRLQAGETDLPGTICLVVILAVVVVYLLRNWSRVVPTLRPLALYLAILTLCGLSALWSDYPFATIRRTVTLATCLGFGLFCYLELGLDATIRRLGRIAAFLCGLSLLVWIALPSVGHETLLGYEGALRGVFSTKNECGTAIVLALSYYIYVALQDRRLVRPVLGGLLLLACLVLVRSSTAATIALIMLVTGGVLYLWRSRLIVLVIFAAGSLCSLIAVMTAFDPELPFALLGRDASFTGRTPLWETSVEAMLERPWLGYGYSGFWNADSRLVQFIWQVTGWQAPSAHNGYIDTVLQIGVLGLALFLWLWARVIYDAVAGMRRGNLPTASWILLFMVINILLNLDEGTLPYPGPFCAMMPGILVAQYTWRGAERARADLAQRTRIAAAGWQRLAAGRPRLTPDMSSKPTGPAQ